MEKVSTGMRIKPKNVITSQKTKEWTCKMLHKKSRQTVSERGGSEKSFTTFTSWRECVRLQPSGGRGGNFIFIFQPQQ